MDSDRHRTHDSLARGASPGVAPSSGGRHAQGRLRILIVDDDDGCRLGVASVLGDDGHDVHTAARGEEALDHARRLRRINQTLDLSILDYHMPDWTGVETFLRLVRELPGIAAVFVSGDFSTSLLDEVRRAGGRALVRKPLDVHRIRTAVRFASRSGAAGGGSSGLDLLVT